MLLSKEKIWLLSKEKFGAAEQKENLVLHSKRKFGAAAQQLVQEKKREFGEDQKRQLPTFLCSADKSKMAMHNKPLVHKQKFLALASIAVQRLRKWKSA